MIDSIHLQEKLGYTFKNQKLLIDALTHRSYINESKRDDAVSNERLEFLGDSVLGVVVAEYLYKAYPDMNEGDLSRHRAAIVCEDNLALFASEIELGSYIYMSNGVDMIGGRGKESILSDAVEAVIAAIYLDSDFDTAKKCILDWFEEDLIEARYESSIDDYKTSLQEAAQERKMTVSYEIVSESGRTHEKVFTAKAIINGKDVSEGTGRSKKKAEQDAAKKALEVFDKMF